MDELIKCMQECELNDNTKQKLIKDINCIIDQIAFYIQIEFPTDNYYEPEEIPKVKKILKERGYEIIYKEVLKKDYMINSIDIESILDYYISLLEILDVYQLKMANRQQLNKIITTISERYNINIDKLEAIVANNGSKIISKFASPIAKQKWEESGQANSELFSFAPSHKKGYTLKDVNIALGIEEPIKKVSVWSSKAAKVEAEKNDLTENDFSQVLESMKKISISDVRKVLGQEDENAPKKFASPWSEKLAQENGLIGNEDFEKLKGSSKKGKYNVEDVKNFLKTNQD